MCDFTDIAAEIESQIVLNGQSSWLCRRALRNPKLTVKEFLDYERAQETSETQASGMEQDQDTVNSVQKQQLINQSGQRHDGRPNKNKEQWMVQRSKRCFNCGGEFPHRKRKSVSCKRENLLSV